MERKSERNLRIIENFILHLIHCSDDESELGYKEHITLTPKLIYEAARNYIEEDHVDGKGTPEEYCIQLWLDAEELNRNDEVQKALILKKKFAVEFWKLSEGERKYVKQYLDDIGG